MAGFLRIANLFQVHTEETQVRYQYSSRSRWPIKQEYSFSSIGITNTHVCQASAKEASSERKSCRPYISLVPVQKFSNGKQVAKNAITTMLCYCIILRPFQIWDS